MSDPSRFVVAVDDESREVAPRAPWTALAFRAGEWPGAAPDAFARGYGATPAEALRGLANHFDRMGGDGMTIGYVEAEWLDSVDSAAVFEGVIFPERWNGFACWATTRPVIEHLNALHESSPDAERLPRFTFDGDILRCTTPDGEEYESPPFELDDDGDHLWQMSLGMVWSAFDDFERKPGAAYRAYRMDGSVEELVLGLMREEE